MKHLFFTVFAVLLLGAAASAQDSVRHAPRVRRIQLGVRGGVNSPYYKFEPTTINGTTFTSGYANIGYDAGLVLRLNATRHLHLQAELNYKFVNYFLNASSQPDRGVTLRTQRLEVPVELGLQFNWLRLFGGVVFRVADSQRSSIPNLLKVEFNDDDIGLIAGVGINIRKFFLDFRIQGYPRWHTQNTFVSDGTSVPVRISGNLVYGGSIGFFF